MKTAYFTHTNESLKKRAVVYGQVTLNDDGKVSVSISNPKHHSFAERHQAKETAKAIVQADFKHPSITTFTEVASVKWLVGRLAILTADFKAEFIVKTIAAAKRMFGNYEKMAKMTTAEWFSMYSIEIKSVTNGGYHVPTAYDAKYYKMATAKSNTLYIVSSGYEKFEKMEVMYAEEHYQSSLNKLASRLSSKGITDNTEMEITVKKITVNIELTILHNGTATKAWTIIAEGPIQRAHYRYMVK